MLRWAVHAWEVYLLSANMNIQIQSVQVTGPISLFLVDVSVLQPDELEPGTLCPAVWDLMKKTRKGAVVESN